MFRPFGPLLKSDRYILEFKTMIRNEILEHEKDHDPEMPPRDFIDMYLNEIKVIFVLVKGQTN